MMIPIHLYRVARNLNGTLRWWSPQEVIPPGHIEQREATPDEVVLMQLIEVEDARGEMPNLGYGMRLIELMTHCHKAKQIEHLRQELALSANIRKQDK